MFMYEGARCRETLTMPPTPANMRYAQALRDEIKSKIVRGTFKYEEYFPSSSRAKKSADVTVGKLFDDYLNDCEKAVKNSSMSPSTALGYRRYIEAQLRPAFGSIKLSELTALHIKEWISACDLTAKAMRLYMTPLRSVMADAINLGLIEVNPLYRLDMGRLVRTHGTKSEYEVNPFTQNEVAQILAACKGATRNLFQFAFSTGLRTSELMALKWDDVNLTSGEVMVRRALVCGVEKATKTKAGTRVVQLDATAKAAIEAQRAFTRLAGGRVFHSELTGLPFENPHQIRKLWVPILKRAKVVYRNPYQTRHTFASTLLSAGANPWWVAEQMGHEGVEMIYRHYGRWIPNARPARSVHA